ncbi:hypothetical protein A0H81_08576 [Grifola frondosa]|uniref:Probable RNA polymerase II nuclear localization protein SLC7A6OS n=1 Tax=Grifola frondosa TaxID=5627 RepID=A0A1C7M4I1_GRIFR|nr:hypothetical protein A0H81_08576 [Grifola frondosa]
MQVHKQTSPQTAYTILRIKRKRNEEPLDALVYDSRPRRKKSRGGLNVFRFVETVEQGAWDDEQKKRDLEVRISTLASEPAQKNIINASLLPAPAPDFVPSSYPPPHVQQRIPSRTYTIVKPEGVQPDSGVRKRAPTAPPKVYSARTLAAARQTPSGFTLYDAIPSSSTIASFPSSSSGDTDAEMEKFLPLLQDYLKVSDGSAPSASIIAPSTSNESAEDADYVWDVFYQRPNKSQEQISSSASGKVATLTGLPPELSGLFDSDSDSEPEDEDDEDSNAEDWYTNDYPEEEENIRSDNSEASDDFHEHSDYEDALYGEDRMTSYALPTAPELQLENKDMHAGAPANVPHPSSDKVPALLSDISSQKRGLDFIHVAQDNSGPTDPFYSGACMDRTGTHLSRQT